jgi:signal transduction histidine kinase
MAARASVAHADTMNTQYYLTALGLIAGCALAVWVRSGLGGPPLTRRGRLREAGWCAAVLLAVLQITDLLQPRADLWARPTTYSSANYAVLLVAGLVLVARPRLSTWLLPAALVYLGFYGFLVLRFSSFFMLWTTRYAFLAIGRYSMQYYLVLPQAYGLMVLGGWLGWRTIDRESRAARLVLGPRLADPARPGQGLALLFVPVAAAAAALVAPNLLTGLGPAGQLWTGGLILAAWLVVRQSPDVAASAATGGLLVLGLAGFEVARAWTTWPLPRPVTTNAIIYAGDLVTTRSMAEVAVAQGIALIGLGVWLIPRTAPRVRRLLGLASTADLMRRVQRLTESRALAVDTASADLRRLERDLHDGAQARLVALGMQLRTAERLVPTQPDAAVALLAEARETSARALTELRELVRGVHPPVLADRGLGDAIQALALDAPLRVETDIDLPSRLPAPVETACYFAVAELLTNAAKHSAARTARIRATHADDRLRITVTDYGLGGADPARGSGLAGVRGRLATFDGTLALSSPPGGPTVVVLDVPCASPADLLSARRETCPGGPKGGPSQPQPWRN